MLLELYLGNNRVSGSSLRSVAALLQHCSRSVAGLSAVTTLLKLYLGNNRVSRSSLPAIYEKKNGLGSTRGAAAAALRSVAALLQLLKLCCSSVAAVAKSYQIYERCSSCGLKLLVYEALSY